MYFVFVRYFICILVIYNTNSNNVSVINKQKAYKTSFKVEYVKPISSYTFEYVNISSNIDYRYDKQTGESRKFINLGRVNEKLLNKKLL